MQKLISEFKQSWVGYCLLIVGILHTLFSILMFYPAFFQIMELGIINSIGNDFYLNAVVWFFLAGIYMLTTAFSLIVLEKSDQPVPWSTSITFSLSVILGLILMPQSGFWLAIPVIFGLFYKSSKSINLPREASA